MAELKPCPFCGSKDIHMIPGDRTYLCACFGCCATSAPRITEQQAIDAWNRRSK